MNYFLELNFYSFMVSYEALTLQQETKKAHLERVYQCVWNYFINIAQNIIIPLLCQCVFFIYTCVSRNSVVFKNVIIYILWLNVMCWSRNICEKSSFASFYSFLVTFSEWDQGGDCKIDKVWQSWIGWKMPLCKWHTFWMTPCFTIFYCYIILYWEKVTSYEKLNHNLTFEVRIV